MTHPVGMVGGVGSLSEYRRSAGAVHSIGWHIVWCPKYRRRVLVGPVADRLRELRLAKAAGRGSCFVASVGRVSEETIRRYIDEQTSRPTRGRP